MSNVFRFVMIACLAGFGLNADATEYRHAFRFKIRPVNATHVAGTLDYPVDDPGSSFTVLSDLWNRGPGGSRLPGSPSAAGGLAKAGGYPDE